MPNTKDVRLINGTVSAAPNCKRYAVDSKCIKDIKKNADICSYKLLKGMFDSNETQLVSFRKMIETWPTSLSLNINIIQLQF